MAGRLFVAFSAGLLAMALPEMAAAASAPVTPAAAPLATSVVAPVPALPLGARSLGTLPPATPLSADVVLKPRDGAALAQLAYAVSSAGPERGHYLTPAELTSRFSPSAGAVAAVAASFISVGLSARLVGDGFTLKVSGRAGALERAFQTPLVNYRLLGGRVAFANARPARLPAAAAGHVESVIGLSDLASYRPLDLRRAASSRRGPGRRRPGLAPQACPAATAQRAGGYTADQLARAYGMGQLWRAGDLGAGETIGLVEFENDSPVDIAAYESCYRIHTKVSYARVDGGAVGPVHGSGEAALDIEDVAALAPAAHILVYQAPNDATGPYDELQYIVDHPKAAVVTTSWGECEPFLGTDPASVAAAAQAEATLFEMAAAEGQSWFSAAGDSGSADCYPTSQPLSSSLAVDDPGSQPFVTSVGGTSLHPAGAGFVETSWNGSGGAGGGGISQVWPMPPYQADAPSSLHVVSSYSSGAPCQAATGYCREVPDVAADASPAVGYSVYYDGGWTAFAGTSAAAPLWAALTGLADASRGCSGRPLGFLNPSLYQLAGTRSYGADFHDVKVGTNDFGPSGVTGGLYPAGPGYDMATGLGSPRATNGRGGLVPALCSLFGTTAPGVLSLSPASGPAAGGTAVTITGYGLTDVTAVYFGSSPATFTFTKATPATPPRLVALAPPGTGTVDVTVRNGSRLSLPASGDLFTYTP